MKDDDSRSRPADDREGQARAPEDSPEEPADSRRQDTVFTDFDEEDFEEADRDTDYGSIYDENDLAEGDDLETPAGDQARHPEDWLTQGRGRGRSGADGGEQWDAEEPTGRIDGDPDPDVEELQPASEPELFDFEEDEGAPEDDDTDAYADENWDDAEPYPDTAGEVENQQEASSGWPLGLVIVGLVALLLLAAGGYGVIQQRLAAQEEIRRLQAALATAASPADVAATRAALEEMERQNTENLSTIEVLTLYNRRLTDTVAGLEQQLAVQQAEAPGASALPDPAGAVAAGSDTAPAVASTAPPTAEPAASRPPASDTADPAGGDWFVNFSSYSQRGAAEKWAKKLRPVAGNAIVAPFEKDGRTLYRVRIVGLTDRAQADKVAGKLRSDYNLPPLWVGRQ